MVINVSRLKSGEYDDVRRDIAEVVHATPHVEHKVILETCYLTHQEKLTACRLVVEAGADYVKTSTGFGAGGATVEDVRLMKSAVAGRATIIHPPPFLKHSLVFKPLSRLAGQVFIDFITGLFAVPSSDTARCVHKHAVLIRIDLQTGCFGLTLAQEERT